MTYAYALWTLFLLLAWTIVLLGLRHRARRRKMLMSSFLTMPLGLTEPIFVPEYWNPPTPFDLAATTGFDLESLGFSFAVGGLASTLYDRLHPAELTPLRSSHHDQPRHRWHRLAMLSPIMSFIVLYWLGWFNPIYSAILALTVGGLSAAYCRPDLARRMMAGAGVFGLFYFGFFLTLVQSHPNYVEQVWNLDAVSGILLLGVPAEEILFALALGFLWSSAYEHITWTGALRIRRYGGPDGPSKRG